MHTCVMASVEQQTRNVGLRGREVGEMGRWEGDFPPLAVV